MTNKSGHRRFGGVRRRSSGRWQARCQGPDGLTRSAHMTFDGKRSAEQWLTLMEGRVLRGEWEPPEQSKIMFGGCDPLGGGSTARAADPRTVRNVVAAAHHVLVRRPGAGSYLAPVGALVAYRSSASRSGSTAAKSYCLLRAIEGRCRVPQSGLALTAGGGGTRAPSRVPPERRKPSDDII
jgi:hypothetical protein